MLPQTPQCRTVIIFGERASSTQFSPQRIFASCVCGLYNWIPAGDATSPPSSVMRMRCSSVFPPTALSSQHAPCVPWRWNRGYALCQKAHAASVNLEDGWEMFFWHRTDIKFYKWEIYSSWCSWAEVEEVLRSLKQEKKNAEAQCTITRNTYQK